MLSIQPSEADKTVGALVETNSFPSSPLSNFPTTEIIEDVLFAPSSDLIIRVIIAIASGFPDGAGGNEIERDILRRKCSNIISFPDNLANFVATVKKEPTHAGKFDTKLYNQKLSDTFWWAFFQDGDERTTSLTDNQKHAFVCAFIYTAVRRGLAPTLWERFTKLSRIGAGRAPEQIIPFLRTVTVGVLDGATNRKSFTSSRNATRTPTRRLGASWSAWLQALVVASVKNSTQKHVFGHFWRSILAPTSAASGTETDSILPNLDISEELCTEIQKYLFEDAVAKIPTPRHHLRFIFSELLPLLNSSEPENAESLTQQQEREMRHLFTAWDAKETVENGKPDVNETIFHAVMYALIFLKNRQHESLPGSVLAPFLNGVTLRMQCVHAERQAYGMTAAAAFATFFVANSEAAGNFLQNKDFSTYLETWLSGESSENTKATFSPQRNAQNSTTGKALSAFVRRELLPEPQTLDPDAPFYFFARREEQANAECQLSEMDAQAVGLPQTEDPNVLPAFGMQHMDSDYTDVAVLKTFREAYESFMGIGRSTNAQLHEVQQGIEAGLYGMSKSLSAMKKDLSCSKQNVTFPEQLNPLIPSLVPALQSVTIHAPPEKTQSLLAIRYSIIVDLIQVSAKMTLHTLSGMLYNSNYGVYQRVEIARAVGDAAKALASIELIGDTTTEGDTAHARANVERKRIYPPIKTTTTEKQSIILEEGKHTRRWGNAVASRIQAKSKIRRYLNVLGEFAPFFIACLLARLDSDHFRFFQETEPFVPAEVLRSLVTTFQGVSKLRHVAPELCQQNIEFFFSVAMHHPHAAVRKQAWVATGEVMRSWCGAPPALEATTDSYAQVRSFSYTGSLVFEESWMRTLEVLQSFCTELDRKKDSTFVVAALTVSMLRDLVCEKADLESMQTSDAGIVSL